MVEKAANTVNTVAKVVWIGAMLWGMGTAAYEAYNGRSNANSQKPTQNGNEEEKKQVEPPTY